MNRHPWGSQEKEEPINEAPKSLSLEILTQEEYIQQPLLDLAIYHEWKYIL
jgi:hypothetical protein